MVTEITDSNYSQLLAQGKPIVIDFNAEWCGPCRKMGPIIETLAEQYDGQVIVGACNVDENEQLPVKFGVMSIPAIFFIKDGQVTDKSIGAVPASTIEAKIKAML